MVRICALLGWLAVAGCSTGEGVRCNQLEVTDQCGAGLKCTVPVNCPGLIAVCCPVDKPSKSSSCNACPALDAATD